MLDFSRYKGDPRSVEIRLSSSAHGIVTKTVHKTLPGGGGGRGSQG